MLSSPSIALLFVICSCPIATADDASVATLFSKLACLIFLSIKSLSATLILGIFGNGVEQKEGGETGEPHDEAMALILFSN